VENLASIFDPTRHKVALITKSSTIADVSYIKSPIFTSVTWLYIYILHNPFPDFLVLCIDIYHTTELCLWVTSALDLSSVFSTANNSSIGNRADMTYFRRGEI